MTSTYEELSYAVCCLGDQGLPSEDIPQKVLNRLAEFNMILVENNSAPVLTNRGQIAYYKIMGSERKYIPEFGVERSARVKIPPRSIGLDKNVAPGEAVVVAPPSI